MLKCSNNYRSEFIHVNAFMIAFRRMCTFGFHSNSFAKRLANCDLLIGKRKWREKKTSKISSYEKRFNFKISQRKKVNQMIQFSQIS